MLYVDLLRLYVFLSSVSVFIVLFTAFIVFFVLGGDYFCHSIFKLHSIKFVFSISKSDVLHLFKFKLITRIS